MRQILAILTACALITICLPVNQVSADSGIRCAKKGKMGGSCLIEIRAPGSGGQPGQPGKPGRPGRPRQDPITRPTTEPTYPGYTPCVGIPCLPLDQQHPPG